MLAGVNGTDPFILMRLFLEELRAMGFAGVQNFPTVGLFDGEMRQSFEETGMSYQLEVDMIALAHELDLLTTPTTATFWLSGSTPMAARRSRNRNRMAGSCEGLGLYRPLSTWSTRRAIPGGPDTAVSVGALLQCYRVACFCASWPSRLRCSP